jgi:hypothetical protein
MQEADGIDIAGQRGERTGQQDVAAGIEHRPGSDPRLTKTPVFMKAASLGSVAA